MGLTLLEKACMDSPGEQISFERQSSQDDPDDWLRFGLVLLAKIGSIIRRVRLQPLKNQVYFKEDGSPATRQESEIEMLAREALSKFSPQAQLIGEETGGRLPEHGIAAAIDPIDGTWAFLNRSETCTTSLVFLKDSMPFLGMVLNPVTGELAYSFSSGRTRLIQFSVFGEGNTGQDLPLDRVQSSSALINIHPQRDAGKLVLNLFKMWNRNELNMVRLPGGSPCFALLEAAKGNFSYVNLWPGKPADPYDLAAGILLVRGAGGEVIDLSGMPIKSLEHSGPFVAGIDKKVMKCLVDVVRDNLPQNAPP
jgi:fructose-1,6-bisphosphatase/inositol monophosphatase family enzyme